MQKAVTPDETRRELRLEQLRQEIQTTQEAKQAARLAMSTERRAGIEAYEHEIKLLQMSTGIFPPSLEDQAKQALVDRTAWTCEWCAWCGTDSAPETPVYRARVSYRWGQGFREVLAPVCLGACTLRAYSRYDCKRHCENCGREVHLATWGGRAFCCGRCAYEAAKRRTQSTVPTPAGSAPTVPDAS